mmetsp:Transcript_109212/g.348463  ORF Transcript_109212/g.348463 Transcript_109212/m.348463 type:complete len:368 (-) Transcript_109212:13-1116(-)
MAVAQTAPSMSLAPGLTRIAMPRGTSGWRCSAAARRRYRRDLRRCQVQILSCLRPASVQAPAPGKDVTVSRRKFLRFRCRTLVVPRERCGDQAPAPALRGLPLPFHGDMPARRALRNPCPVVCLATPGTEGAVEAAVCWRLLQPCLPAPEMSERCSEQCEPQFMEEDMNLSSAEVDFRSSEEDMKPGSAESESLSMTNFGTQAVMQEGFRGKAEESRQSGACTSASRSSTPSPSRGAAASSCAMPDAGAAGLPVSSEADIRVWVAPACKNGRVDIRRLRGMLKKELVELDPDEIADALIEWLGGPGLGTLPKTLGVETVVPCVLFFFEAGCIWTYLLSVASWSPLASLRLADGAPREASSALEALGA